ncbi:MAG: hypothetical protein K2N58_08405, partial [Treponemataceae bacterium]|nr:hypothetical protein [Treponemataceae bacterium]
PNTEVKPPCADDTALSGRESRWPPGFFFFPARPALREAGKDGNLDCGAAVRFLCLGCVL